VFSSGPAGQKRSNTILLHHTEIAYLMLRQICAVSATAWGQTGSIAEGWRWKRPWESQRFSGRKRWLQFSVHTGTSHHRAFPLRPIL